MNHDTGAATTDFFNTLLDGAAGIADALRVAQLHLGEEVLDQLRSAHNIDSRVFRKFEQIHAALQAGDNVIMIGTLVGRIVRVRYEYPDELPDPILADIDDYIEGLRRYVSQFSEWHLMQRNLFTAGFSAREPSEITELANAVIDRLAKVPEVVAPEVPELVAKMRDAAIDTLAGDDRIRAQFNLVRTLGNLGVSLAKMAGGFGRKCLEKLQDKAAETVAAATLFVGTVTVINIIGPAHIMQILTETRWIESAAKALEALAKSLGSAS